MNLQLTANAEQTKVFLTELFNTKSEEKNGDFVEGCNLLEKLIGKEGVDKFLDELLEADA